eukprot:scaffold27445_cov175-Skeletonema_marinoi.AAC.1
MKHVKSCISLSTEQLAEEENSPKEIRCYFGNPKAITWEIALSAYYHCLLMDYNIHCFHVVAKQSAMVVIMPSRQTRRKVVRSIHVLRSQNVCHDGT